MEGEEVKMGERLRRAMRDDPSGSLSFQSYMAFCLYEPGIGYYQQERLKIGRAGDFYTSSHLGTIMGEMLARYIQRQWSHVAGELCLVEWGAGSGRLLRQVCDALKQQDPMLARRIRWVAVEVSAYHAQVQRQSGGDYAIEQMTPEEAWSRQWPQHTILYANELLDALPVHRLRYVDNRGWEEQRVSWNDDEQLFESSWRTINRAERPWMREMESEWERIGHRPRSGQIIEWNEEAGVWIARTAQTLSAGGQMLLIDYGDESNELFAAHRMQGTLVCYYRHQAHDRFLERPGGQDMTAHVNFSTVMQAAKTAGMKVMRYRTQKKFLIEEGVLELLVEHQTADPFAPEAKRNRAIRQLLISDQMSELFKVLIVGK